MQLAAASPGVSLDASVLYSSLSGEEILQQWLLKHPELVEKYKKTQTARDRKSAEEQEKTSSDAELQVDVPHRIPCELEPYRDILPPSLLPPALKVQFPGSSDFAEWG